MQHREVRVSSRSFRAALVVFCALAGSLLPSSLASQQTGTTDGRPRRTNDTTTQKAATPTPKSSPTPDYDRDEPPPPRLQTAPGATSTPTPDPQAGAGQEVGDDETITVNSQLVMHQVRVVDRYNRPVKDVRKEDFRVYDNGVLQNLEFFETREVPISYGIVVDNSGSLRNQINQVIEASKTIINSNREDDEAFVVRFVSSEEIKVMQDWTASKQDLIDAMEDMFVEGGQTAIIDAVYLAAEHAASHKKGNDLEDKRRRALILVTDGEDRASFYKKEQLFEALRENDVQIFVIGFVNELDKEGGIIRKSKREKAKDLLEQISKETGGRAFYPTSITELPDIAKEITKDLRTQYVVGYVPSNPAQAGEFRPVRVQIADAPGREKRIAVTRAGYTAQRTTGSNTPKTNNSPSAVKRP